MSFPHSEGPGLKIYEMVSNERLRVIEDMLRAMGYTGDRYFVDQDVGNDTDATTGAKDDPFDTIDYAVGRTTANNGDVIFILPSTSSYDENANATGVTVDVAGIAIVGSGGTSVDIVNSHASASALITVSVSNVLLANLYSSEATNTVNGIEVTGDGITGVRIIDCDFSGTDLENGIRLYGSGTDGVKNCRIENVSVLGAINDGIELAGVAKRNVIKDCYIRSVSDNGIHLNGDDADYNRVVGCSVEGENQDTTVGIKIAAGDYNTIEDCRVVECASPISDSGTANTWDVKVDVAAHGNFNRTVANDVNEDTGDIDDIAIPMSGDYEVALDVNSLEAANEGGTITFRLYRKIDTANYRVIDKVTYVEGVDEVFPTLSGTFKEGINQLRVSHQTSLAVTANRIIYYEIVQKGR